MERRRTERLQTARLQTARRRMARCRTAKAGATRRNALSLGAAAFAAPFLNFGRFRLFAQSETAYSTRAVDLVRSSLVIDALSILHPLDQIIGPAPRENSFRLSPAHIAKLRASGVDVFHPAVGIGGPEARAEVARFLGGLNGVAAQHPDVFLRIDEAADFARARETGRIGVILGVQNSDHFRSSDDVDRFHHLGQRISQLTYNSRNLIGSGSTERSDGGLSDFGVAIVGRMNAVGMAVDVSHCGDKTTIDAFEISEKPVLITHSNARALTPGHPRCKSDEAIRKMAASGGVMGITGVRNFVRDREPTTIEHLLDHFDHVARLVGVEHAGVGSDMDLDGYDDMEPERLARLRGSYSGAYAFRDKLDTDGFDHPQRIFDLADGLIRRVYADADIGLMLGGNFERVLGEIWSV